VGELKTHDEDVLALQSWNFFIGMFDPFTDFDLVLVNAENVVSKALKNEGVVVRFGHVLNGRVRRDESSHRCATYDVSVLNSKGLDDT
jgi:hypothetical protein